MEYSTAGELAFNQFEVTVQQTLHMVFGVKTTGQAHIRLCEVPGL